MNTQSTNTLKIKLLESNPVKLFMSKDHTNKDESRMIDEENQVGNLDVATHYLLKLLGVYYIVMVLERKFFYFLLSFEM